MAARGDPAQGSSGHLVVAQARQESHYGGAVVAVTVLVHDLPQVQVILHGLQGLTQVEMVKRQ